MPLSEDKVEKISLEVIKVLHSRFKSLEDTSNIRNAPFHKVFLNAFENKIREKINTDVPTFLSLSSWMHGLNTTLGQTFFENVAHILCEGEKRVYTTKSKRKREIHLTQEKAINQILTDFGSNVLPNIHAENKKIFITDNSRLINSTEFTADVFFTRKRDVFAIELKTVQPNSNEMQGEKRKILHGKAVLSREFPNYKIHFYLGFPFDPTNPDAESKTTFDKDRFTKSIVNFRKFFANDEFLIASELWNFLSQEENTMEEILEIINRIATTDFEENYKFINDPENRLNISPKYTDLLRQWNLFSEIDFNIRSAFDNDGRFVEIFTKNIFKDGKRDGKRFQKLKSL